MFDRQAIKNVARENLRRRHWLVVLVTLIAGALGGTAAGGVSFSTGVNFPMSSGDTSGGVGVESDPSVWFVIVIVLVVVMTLYTLLMVVAIGYTLFLGNVVRVGFAAWTLRYHRGEIPSVGALFLPFKQKYKQSVSVMFHKDLRVFLWSLLFLIPGIVKGYAYMMVPYLLQDNPHLTPKRALEISNEMTMGYKGDLFVLNLSFIGWRLLNICTFGILGALFVNPYYELALAGAYDHLKWVAIQSGKLSPYDFGIYDVPPAQE